MGLSGRDVAKRFDAEPGGGGIRRDAAVVIRRVVFRIHLSVAVGAAAVILMMSLTGALLSLRAPVLALAERRHFADLVEEGTAVEAGALAEAGALVERDALVGGGTWVGEGALTVEGALPQPEADDRAARLTPAEIVAAAEGALSGDGDAAAVNGGTPFTATSLRYRSDPRAPVRVFAGRGRHADLDPWTGAVLAVGPGRAERFFEAVEGWHRWFNVSGGSVRRARAVTGAANLALLALLLTGPVLWWPRAPSRSSLGRALRLRRGTRGALRDLDWHQVVGIWSAAPLAIIVATGIATSYPGVGDRVNPVVGRGVGGGGWPEAAGVVGEERGGAQLSGVLATAMSWAPGWKTLVLTLPRPRDEVVRVEVRGGAEGQPHRTGHLTIDARNAAVRGWRTFADETPGRRGQQFLRYAHTGEYWGWWGGVLAGLFSAAAALMVWTGLSLAARRAVRFVGLRSRRLRFRRRPR